MLKSGLNNMLKRFGTNKEFLKIQDTLAWKQGKKDFKEGTYKLSNQGYHWVKRLFSRIEWNTFYSGNSSHCLLGMVDGKPMVGFLTTCQDERHKPCTDSDLRKIDSYRRVSSIRPFPFPDIEDNWLRIE